MKLPLRARSPGGRQPRAAGRSKALPRPPHAPTVPALEYAMKLATEDAIDDVEARVRDELADEGFGVLTEIDVQATLKEKLGKDTRDHRILGACNPELADRGLSAEPDLGVMLPCNVTLYEDDGRTIVSAMKPTGALEIVDNPAIDELAEDAEARVSRALDRACPDGTEL